MSYRYSEYEGPEFPLEAKLPRGEYWLVPFAPLQRPTRRSLRWCLQRLAHGYHEAWFRCYDTSRLTMELHPARSHDVAMLRSRVDWMARILRRFDMHIAREVRAARRDRHHERKERASLVGYTARTIVEAAALEAPQVNLVDALYGRINAGFKRKILADERRCAAMIAAGQLAKERENG